MHLLTTDGIPQTIPEYYSLWLLINQNLTATLYSIISPTLLPYVLKLEICHNIWQTIKHRLQSTNRSKISQLKHELYTISMRDPTMTRYLSLLKSKVDALTAAGSKLDTEGIIHYTLNGLSPTCQSFKTAIRISNHFASMIYTCPSKARRLTSPSKLSVNFSTIPYNHITQPLPCTPPVVVAALTPPLAALSHLTPTTPTLDHPLKSHPTTPIPLHYQPAKSVTNIV